MTLVSTEDIRSDSDRLKLPELTGTQSCKTIQPHSQPRTANVKLLDMIKHLWCCGILSSLYRCKAYNADQGRLAALP